MFSYRSGLLVMGNILLPIILLRFDLQISHALNLPDITRKYMTHNLHQVIWIRNQVYRFTLSLTPWQGVPFTACPSIFTYNSLMMEWKMWLGYSNRLDNRVTYSGYCKTAAQFSLLIRIWLAKQVANKKWYITLLKMSTSN